MLSGLEMQASKFTGMPLPVVLAPKHRKMLTLQMSAQTRHAPRSKSEGL